MNDQPHAQAEVALETLDTFDTILEDALTFMLSKFISNGMTPSLHDMERLEEVIEESLQQFDHHMDAVSDSRGFESLRIRKKVAEIYGELVA
ncbi:hypothetical protein [Zavarzinella formosa]|uniref:hypothetical protein n=1 Tax=Zavarzinella formosa TaxID=360055 RepID=UPI0002DC9B0D|nr:hypothetical protein [Zavarzinella formosa]